MRTNFALVLAGGGARGAYEAGVLRFILRDLPSRIGHPIGPDLICGSSVGALNGATIAAWNQSPEGPETLSEFWTSLSCADVYRFVALDLLRSPMRVLRGPANDEMAWVDARPLHALMRETYPWPQLHKTIDQGRLTALVVTATEVSTGLCVQFIDGHIAADSLEIHTGIRREHTRIGAEHILASCAIPFLFPPIEIDGQPMVDGSLRQNTPVSPALRLGADHVLVVGTRHPKEPTAEPIEELPSTPALLGKALNALLLDPVHQDLTRIDLINRILEAGSAEYGPEFVHRLNARLQADLSQSLRPVNTLCIHPSEDLGVMAASAWNPDEIDATRGTRIMLSTIAGDSEESDLLSYMLFDKSYTAAIEALGYEDAKNQETEIIRFVESALRASDS